MRNKSEEKKSASCENEKSNQNNPEWVVTQVGRKKIGSPRRSRRFRAVSGLTWEGKLIFPAASASAAAVCWLVRDLPSGNDCWIDTGLKLTLDGDFFFSVTTGRTD